jgi:hypothetical protein
MQIGEKRCSHEHDNMKRIFDKDGPREPTSTFFDVIDILPTNLQIDKVKKVFGAKTSGGPHDYFYEETRITLIFGCKISSRNLKNCSL